MAKKPLPKEMPPMTARERRANWWHYHWHHVLIVCLALCALAGAAWERLSKAAPDCCVALVTRYAPTPQEIAALQDALGSVCPDVNGDGKVSVAVNDIQIDYTSTAMDDAAIMVMTANVDKLNADFYTCQSGIFLLDDPENFQKAHHALCYLDGSVPEEGAEDWEDMAVPLGACPAAAGLRFGNIDAQALYFARRGAVTEEERAAFAGANALWERLVPAG